VWGARQQIAAIGFARSAALRLEDHAALSRTAYKALKRSGAKEIRLKPEEAATIRERVRTHGFPRAYGEALRRAGATAEQAASLRVLIAAASTEELMRPALLASLRDRQVKRRIQRLAQELRAFAVTAESRPVVRTDIDR